ncbi:acyltransferase family protein, partial [Novosphingobium clariflavum]
HVFRGLHDAGIFADERTFRLFDDAIYMFHMPAFFLISGLLFRTREWSSFASRSAWNIVLPYFLWGAVVISLQIALSSAANADATWGNLLWLPIKPYSIFWFLYALLLIQIVAQLVLPYKHGAWLLLGFGVVAALAEQSVLPKGLGALNSASTFLVYFAIGHILSKAAKTNQGSAWGATASLIAFVCIDLTAIALEVPVEGLAGRCIGLVLAMLFVGIFIFTPQLRAWRAFRKIGEDTIAIYCLHTIFTAGTRVVLVKAGVSSLPLHVMAAFAAGLIGPLVAFEIARRMGITKYLGFGATPVARKSGETTTSTIVEPAVVTSPSSQIGGD